MNSIPCTAIIFVRVPIRREKKNRKLEAPGCPFCHHTFATIPRTQHYACEQQGIRNNTLTKIQWRNSYTIMRTSYINCGSAFCAKLYAPNVFFVKAHTARHNTIQNIERQPHRMRSTRSSDITVSCIAFVDLGYQQRQSKPS